MAVPIYVYFGYPLFVFLISRFRQTPARSSAFFPEVSLIIPAYNEEVVIGHKIENCLGLDYPQDKLEILVASDGSTDKTAEIASQYRVRGVRLLAYPNREGKPALVRKAVAEASHPIVAVSDAKAMLGCDALKILVRPFADPGVGSVSGRRAVVVQEQSTPSFGEDLFFRYESFLKTCESKLAWCMAAEGQLYAYRRALFLALEHRSGPANDDFLVPLQMIVRFGVRIVYEPDAVAFIPAAASLGGEIDRKARTKVSMWNHFPEFRAALIPFRSPVWWQLASHYVGRTLTPFAMLALVPLSLVLYARGWMYAAALWVQILFYALASIGGVLASLRLRPKLFYAPFYFCLANWAVLVSWARLLRGEHAGVWKTTERIIKFQVPAGEEERIHRDHG